MVSIGGGAHWMLTELLVALPDHLEEEKRKDHYNLLCFAREINMLLMLKMGEITHQFQ